MPKRGFWNDRNYYQAQRVSYVKSSGRMYRLVYGQDGTVVQGYDLEGRVIEMLTDKGVGDIRAGVSVKGTSLFSSLLKPWLPLLRICWRK